MNNLICIDCGNKVEEGKCYSCKKKLAAGVSLDIKDYYIEKELIKRNEDRNKYIISLHWIERFKRNFRGTKLNFNCCNNCEYFMYHTLNYCYKCGNKLISVVMNADEFAEKYPNYREGY